MAQIVFGGGPTTRKSAYPVCVRAASTLLLQRTLFLAPTPNVDEGSEKLAGKREYPCSSFVLLLELRGSLL